MANQESGSETGPKPLSISHITSIRSGLRQSFIPEVAEDESLRRLGVLRQLDIGLREDRSQHRIRTWLDTLPQADGSLIWSPVLLSLPTYHYHAQIIQSRVPFIRVSDEAGNILAEVQAKDLRDIINGYSMVINEAGYLAHDGEWQDATTRALLLANRGLDPKYYDNSPFVKVLDKGYEGKRLIGLEIENGTLIGDWVVIDSQTRQLVRRAVEQPLAYARWGVRQPRSRDFIWDELTC